MTRTEIKTTQVVLAQLFREHIRTRLESGEWQEGNPDVVEAIERLIPVLQDALRASEVYPDDEAEG